MECKKRHAFPQAVQTRSSKNVGGHNRDKSQHNGLKQIASSEMRRTGI